MTTTTEARTRERTTWICENCHSQTSAVRKRCTECGTSRY
jgi:hypothetical protein